MSWLQRGRTRICICLNNQEYALVFHRLLDHP
jgi:hypothetical protein